MGRPQASPAMEGWLCRNGARISKTNLRCCFTASDLGGLGCPSFTPSDYPILVSFDAKTDMVELNRGSDGALLWSGPGKD